MDGSNCPEAHFNDAPPVAHYRPNFTSVDKKNPAAIILSDQKYQENLNSASN